jgi:hypothetical protein
MANLKYFIEYDDIHENTTRIEIADTKYLGSPIELTAGEVPLLIDLESGATKFEPVRGSGGSIGVLSSDNFQLRDLFTDDIFQFPVTVKKNGVTFWNGYINSEIYSEDYSMSSNYGVSLEVNDGLTLLNRLKFLTPEGDNYKGFMTIWDVIKLCFDRIGLTHKHYFVSCGKFPEGLSHTAGESPFHKVLINTQNYYDEEDKPLTLREVLEAVLRPFGCTLFKSDGCIHIVDVSYFAVSTLKRQVYGSDFSYQSTETVNITKNISSGDVWFTGGEQRLDVVGGFNKQALVYSPYGSEEIFPSLDFKDFTRWQGDYYWKLEKSNNAWNKNYNYSYTLTDVSGYEGLKLYNYAKIYSKIWGFADWSTMNDQYVNTHDAQYYIFTNVYKHSHSVYNTVMLETDDSFSDIHVAFTKGNNISIKVSLQVSDIDDTYNHPNYEGTAFHKITVPLALKCAGKTYNQDSGQWESGDNWIEMSYAETSKLSSLHNTKRDLEVNIELKSLPAGKMGIKLRDAVRIFKLAKDDGDYTEIDDNTGRKVFISKIELKATALETYKTLYGTDQEAEVTTEVTDFDDSDIEYEAVLNKNFASEGDEIKLIHGDSYGNNLTDRGGFRKPDLTFTDKWVKDSESTSYPITSLLLRSVISNYRAGSTTLAGKIKSKTIMASPTCKDTSYLSFLSTIMDTTYLGYKRFMCMGGQYDDLNQYIDGNWIEVYPDDLSIDQ